MSSVRNMLHRLGHDAEFRQTPDGLTYTDRYILPGVGAFDEGVRRLQANGWYDHLRAAPETTHILGICLGMQLLGRSSEEGQLGGLGRIPARFVRFRGGNQIPHMGWNAVTEVRDDRIFEPALTGKRYYFTHTYHAVCADPEVTLATTEYGGPFPSVCRVGNTYGVQFHPEKSHRFGMSLLSHWADASCS